MIILTIAIGGVVLVALFVYLWAALYVVRQSETIVIERLGKFQRVLMPGVHMVVPFWEKPRAYLWTFFREEQGKYHKYTRRSYRVDVRELVYDFPKQNVITKDNVTMEISAVLYYHVIDPVAALYAVADLPGALEKLTQTTLRNVVGAMDLDETLVSRDLVNTKIRTILGEAAQKWGVHVTRVELQEVNPPRDIREAMEKQMRAERDRRAVILEAEGRKQAMILDAEGAQAADILTAQGQAQARIINAESEAQGLMKIAQAEAQNVEYIKAAFGDRDPAAYLIALQYIKALPRLAEGKDNKLIIVPYEAQSMMSALSTIKSIFEKS